MDAYNLLFDRMYIQLVGEGKFQDERVTLKQSIHSNARMPATSARTDMHQAQSSRDGRVRQL